MRPSHIQIVECPRDAMQGITPFIPTQLKAQYLNQLLKVGFHTLDFGSFVSPKAIPQLADTAEVLDLLDTDASDTQLLAIVANKRGAETAVQYPQIKYLGYPFSISETFQQRNTKKSIAESLDLVKAMQALCLANGKELVVYISMAFGNPYGDPWSPEIAERWVDEMVKIGVQTIAMADTIGVADPSVISPLFETLIPRFPNAEIGAHFHSHPDTRQEKLEAAWEAGCRRFDVAMKGFGGCPFAEDELVGNISTESLLEFCAHHTLDPRLNNSALQAAMELSQQVFA
ncbi:hydroxymethylglutaryl-CoA lyase [Pontibacter sp. G13]|uniref:hydroxymethylglutaryl-CoA lyase n=1 Tax=Pontibacter sp. G13 TaxID=3074898 RepID=UPI00288AF40E|nr:hydroxymethylglutaryl-CoA lyase [Pontibacter sp. G13]WNJ16292.1 hydroxymethylglutaryl-CoA lyase [Pontibacter sp. G13]